MTDIQPQGLVYICLGFQDYHYKDNSWPKLDCEINLHFPTDWKSHRRTKHDSLKGLLRKKKYYISVALHKNNTDLVTKLLRGLWTKSRGGCFFYIFSLILGICPGWIHNGCSLWSFSVNEFHLKMAVCMLNQYR